MVKFNINYYMYVEITDEGWQHIRKTVDEYYINNHLKNKKKVINGRIWYKLQCWECFQLMPPTIGKHYFEANVMFDEESLSNFKVLPQK